MSVTLLYILSVVEVVALVVVLALYLLKVAGQLRSIDSTLAEVAWGARAVERQLRAVGSNVGQVNSALGDVVGALPGVTRKLEDLGGRGARVR